MSTIINTSQLEVHLLTSGPERIINGKISKWSSKKCRIVSRFLVRSVVTCSDVRFGIFVHLIKCLRYFLK